ncbi:MAG: 16S rRNA (cytosine(1402)-N(4))-methyltransferase RsmH [Marinicellaceae bacterium]
MKNLHETVLLKEAVMALEINKNGKYVDATFGRGGHSQLILSQLESGQLLAIDQDPKAIKQAQQINNDNLLIEHGAFEQLEKMVTHHFTDKVDGILFDLGVSSPQIDEASRGFSFNKNGPLDMRMNTESGETAAEWLNRASWKEISKVLWRYGEEKNATKIAKEIVIYREEVKPLETTNELVSIVEKINKYSKKHPATRTFQAIRIHLNRELEQIENVLPAAINCLKKKGRLVVISFHSLEDRLVKRFFKKLSSASKFDKRMPIAPLESASIKIVGKPTKASESEVEHNPRSRSAIMRVVEKL